MIEAIMRISPTMDANQGYNDLDSPPPDSNNQEDQRALQIALELSNLGLLGPGDDDSSTSSYDEITKSKKSQNMTECVPVPSSEHVAEIVGRQGCKIKALRAKTNTYIKTPVRGEEPVFVVTGRKEDVALARREIQSAAEHFTQIRATRNKGVATTAVPGNAAAVITNMTHMPGAPTAAELSAPGMITLQVRVPYRVVGLVVGPKGATIKRIQQQTHTYIVTPSREKEPVFEVTGLPENVEKAKEDIEAHIATRTGCQQLNIEEDFANNGILVGSPAAQQLAKQNLSLLSQPFYNKPQQPPQNLQSSAFSSYNNVMLPNQRQNSFENQDFAYIQQNYRAASMNHQFVNPNGLGLNEIESRLDTITRKYSNESVNPAWSSNIDYQSDSCFSPLMPTPQAMSYNMEQAHSVRTNSNCSTSPPLSNILTHRLSPTLSDPDYITAPAMIPPVCTSVSMPMKLTRPSQDSVTDSIPEFGTKTIPIGINTESGYSSGGTDSQTSGSVDSMTSAGSVNAHLSKIHRTCISCQSGAVMAALVPCGHNLFCFNCAQRAVETASSCPSCNQTATMALLIKT